MHLSDKHKIEFIQVMDGYTLLTLRGGNERIAWNFYLHFITAPIMDWKKEKQA